jgi:hypothetical protein
VSRRNGGVEVEGVQPVCCDHVEENSKHDSGEGLASLMKMSFWSIRMGWVRESAVRL